MAVDQSAFQTQGSAAKAPGTYLIKDKTGAISEVEIGRDQLQAVSNGYHRLRLRGMSVPFEMDGAFGKSRNVRIVLQVRGGSEDKRMFSQLLTVAKWVKTNDGGGYYAPNVTAKTAIGQMIGVIRGTPIAEGEPINFLDYLNGEFNAVVKQETKATDNGMETRCSVVKDTWQPVQQQAMPEPAPAAAAPPPVASDPFGLDDD